MTWPGNALARTLLGGVDWRLPAEQTATPPDTYTPPAPHPQLNPADDWQPAPPWTGQPTERPPSTLLAEVEAANAAHHAHVAALPDGGGVLGDRGTEWQETPVQPSWLPVRRTR